MKKHTLSVILFIAIIAIIGLAAATFLLVDKKQDTKDNFNIILISIDTLRADHLGCYHYPHHTSPGLDTFREDSVLFRRCMAQAPSTLASHASILTSLIPSHHGAFFTRSQALPEHILTTAEILRSKGYRTASFNDGGQIAAEFGMAQGFDVYESMGGKIKTEQLNFNRVVNAASQWLEYHGSEKFFLFLHTYETHHPYTPSDSYLKLFDANYNGSLPNHISVDIIEKINTGEIQLTPADQQHIIAAYDAEIRSMDDSFSMLMDFLKQKKLYNPTLIIFTSDHGEEFGEHGTWATHSHTLYNDQLHVPLIIKLPGSQFAGRKVDRLVRSIDILPTILELVGDTGRNECEGFSLVPFMKGIPPKTPVFAVSQRDMQETYVPGYWSIMTRQWKLYDGKLFDLLKDPDQLHDVSSAHASLKKDLEKFALRYIKEKQEKSPDAKVVLDEEAKQKLKSLGYLD